MVVLRLGAVAARAKYVKIITPKSSEAALVKGCQRKPVEEVTCLPLLHETTGTAAEDNAFLEITAKAERQLCGFFDCYARRLA